jgi:hypothetical protein
MKMETMQLNNIMFKVGNKYLYRIVSPGTIYERKAKISISRREREELKDILKDNGLFNTDKWHKIAKFYSDELENEDEYLINVLW